MDSQNALHLIKFWLDTESFRMAAELCSKKSGKTKSNELFDKSKFKNELLEFYNKEFGTDDKQEVPGNNKKHVLNKSVSLDACSTTNNYIEQNYADRYDCESMSSNSMYEEECAQQDQNNSDCSSGDVSLPADLLATNGEEDTEFETKLCDMGRPLTDDEKSQLCEQKQQNLKQQQQIESQEKEQRKRTCFKSSLASDAIRIFKKYLTAKSQHYVDVPVTILSTISLSLCSADDVESTTSINELFVEAQTFILDYLERMYLNQFIESSFYCKYCVDVLTDKSLRIQDILYSESALFYFMEFLEQENQRQYLDFWMAAINFKKLLKHAGTETMLANQQAQGDALVLYEKYFSLQATSSLQLTDRVRCKVEENICTDKGPISYHCFDYPLSIIECYLDHRYFKQFLMSHLFYKYLSELLHRIDGKPVPNNALQLPQSKSIGQKSRHRKTFSDCSNERTLQYRQTTAPFISTQNTLLAMENTNLKSKIRSNNPNDMHIDARQLSNPDLLWRRNSIGGGLCLGRVDALGRYERTFEMEPVPSDQKVTLSTTGNKFKQAVRKLVNLPEDKVQEEIAWQMAEIIVKDITNITLNSNKYALDFSSGRDGDDGSCT